MPRPICRWLMGEEKGPSVPSSTSMKVAWAGPAPRPIELSMDFGEQMVQRFFSSVAADIHAGPATNRASRPSSTSMSRAVVAGLSAPEGRVGGLGGGG